MLGPKQLAPRPRPSHEVKGIVTPFCYAPCFLDGRNIQQPLKEIVAMDVQPIWKPKEKALL